LREAADARPPTPVATRPEEYCPADFLFPYFSLCWLASSFSFISRKHETSRTENFLNLPMHTARIPPVDPAPATIAVVLAMHTGHICPSCATSYPSAPQRGCLVLTR